VTATLHGIRSDGGWGVMRSQEYMDCDVRKQGGCRLRPPVASFDPTGREQAEPGSSISIRTVAEPGNRVFWPVQQLLKC